jgi:hypothetical protein
MRSLPQLLRSRGAAFWPVLRSLAAEELEAIGRHESTVWDRLMLLLQRKQGLAVKPGPLDRKTSGRADFMRRPCGPTPAKPDAPYLPSVQRRRKRDSAQRYKPPVTKYRAKKQVVDGITFASRAEARRYGELKILQQAGKVSELQLQVPFVLAPAVLIRGANRKSPALRYVADFVFVRDGARVIEDVKGALTQAYRIKRHLMAVQGLHITEVKA